MKLEKRKFGKSNLAYVTAEWDYKVHNITEEDLDYNIPFYLDTYSFLELGIPLQDHIKLETVVASRTVGQKVEQIDIGKENDLYKIVPKQVNPNTVALEFEKKPAITLAGKETVNVCIKAMYVARLIDRHTQRVVNLTRNTKLHMDFSEKDFYVDVDHFCLAKMMPTGKHSYEWTGWLLPQHGVIAKWQPMPIQHQ